MPIDVPPGYLTRGQAADVYNRSQRSLERDLENAQKAGDSETLSAFKLIANNLDPQEAQFVTKEMVEELQQQGRNPAWCVSTVWLETKFGLKGESKPRTVVEPEQVSQSYVDPADKPEDLGQSIENSSSNASNATEVEFLRERIRRLEFEKQQEIERNKERENKLFSQLAVKDGQINRWDELTQGLAKGLATGQLKPDPDAKVVLLDQSQQTGSIVKSNESAKETKQRSSGPSNAVKKTSAKSKSSTKKSGTKKNSKSATEPKKNAKPTKKSTSKSATHQASKRNEKQASRKSKGILGLIFGSNN